MQTEEEAGESTTRENGEAMDFEMDLNKLIESTKDEAAQREPADKRDSKLPLPDLKSYLLEQTDALIEQSESSQQKD